MSRVNRDLRSIEAPRGGGHGDLAPELLELNHRVIGCAIEVHRVLGPGLAESLYESAMCIELARSGIPHLRQIDIPVSYRDQHIGHHRLDLLIDDALIIELKAVELIAPVHRAQLIGYLKLTGKPVGLLINFNVPVLTKGIERFVNTKPPVSTPPNSTQSHLAQPTHSSVTPTQSSNRAPN